MKNEIPTTTEVTDVAEQTISNSANGCHYLEFVAHLSASYENAQRTIRFLDTKATGVLVLVTSLVGLTGLSSKWVIDLIIKDSQQILAWPLNGVSVTTFAAILIIISFIVCLIKTVSNALKCLAPKDPGGTCTVLFPYYYDKPIKTDAIKSNSLFEEHLERFQRGSELQLAKEEYVTQIRRVGVIVNEKLGSSSKSIIWLKWLLLFSIAFVVTSVFLFAATIGLMG